jgi:hypothetical protein
MSSRLASRLSATRQSRFVGRVSEQALFQSALAESELPLHMLYVFGPGGVGKSTLLRLFADHCEQNSIPIIQIDARNVEPMPGALFDALRLAMNLERQDSPFEVIAARPGYTVLLIDTYEVLAPLDDWVRETLLGDLPENTLIVLAGRNPPSTAWRADPAWQTLIRVIPVCNLSPQESRNYLTRREIPPDQHQAVLDFTQGHPLALSLVADVFAQRDHYQFRPEDAPDVVRVLLDQFAQKAPGPAHRTALEVCALVHVMTESLLAHMLRQTGPADVATDPRFAKAFTNCLNGCAVCRSSKRAAKDSFRTIWRVRPWPPTCAGAIRTGTRNCTIAPAPITRRAFSIHMGSNSSAFYTTMFSCTAIIQSFAQCWNGKRAAGLRRTRCAMPIAQP